MTDDQIRLEAAKRRAKAWEMISTMVAVLDGGGEITAEDIVDIIRRKHRELEAWFRSQGV